MKCWSWWITENVWRQVGEYRYRLTILSIFVRSWLRRTCKMYRDVVFHTYCRKQFTLLGYCDFIDGDFLSALLRNKQVFKYSLTSVWMWCGTTKSRRVYTCFRCRQDAPNEYIALELYAQLQEPPTDRPYKSNRFSQATKFFPPWRRQFLIFCWNGSEWNNSIWFQHKFSPRNGPATLVMLCWLFKFLENYPIMSHP